MDEKKNDALAAIDQLVTNHVRDSKAVDVARCAQAIAARYPESGLTLGEISGHIEAGAVRNHAVLLSSPLPR